MDAIDDMSEDDSDYVDEDVREQEEEESRQTVQE